MKSSSRFPRFSSSPRTLCSLCLILCSLLPSPLRSNEPYQYQLALPGYHYSFPHDHFNHPNFQTEWWYYTGNLQSPDGHNFGFELTFFRQAFSRVPAKNSAWDAQDLYFAHLALSDLDGGHFYHAERANRSGPGIAGASETTNRIWNGNWQILWKDSANQQLQAIDNQFEFHFTLHSEKPPIINGENGVSQKSEGAGYASHYISLTRLITNGEILLNNKKFQVTGTSWMDHEFFTRQLAPNQTGWDWSSLQLNDNSELMLYRIRRSDGSVDPFSAGTFTDAQGHSIHLRASDFTLQPAKETWTSPASHAIYPIHWQIAIPKLSITLEAKTRLANQELASTNNPVPTYWEGAIQLTGTRNNEPIQGVGYLEMTGYNHPVNLAP
jgi:predicted secreted hydrolase